jgi:hypothetical protein
VFVVILFVGEPERAGTLEDFVFGDSFLDTAPIAAPIAAAPIAAAATTFDEGDFFSAGFDSGALIFWEDGALLAGVGLFDADPLEAELTEAMEDFAVTLPVDLAGAALFETGFEVFPFADLEAGFAVAFETALAAGFDELFAGPFAAAFETGFDFAAADFAIGLALFADDFAGFFVCFAM